MTEQTKPEKVIAVLGGSFDPFTNAHLKMSAEIIHSKHADEVWIVPCAPRRDKKIQTSILQRVLMAHMAVNSSFGSKFPVFVRDDEVSLEYSEGTYSLMKKLKEKYPTYQFWFVIGTDLIADLRKWSSKDIENAGMWLWDNMQFLLIPRPGYEISHRTEDLPKNHRILAPLHGLTVVNQELSSSEFRKRFKANPNSVEGLTPAIILAHLLRYGMFQGKSESHAVVQ
eukprot:c14180_g1_i2.p1 GENE.c14180_g1_i2~~c14180_g1_i2.p1  ORF type:complete len:233 (+),score=89.66 c14180_g1_i2:24-701(+)